MHDPSTLLIGYPYRVQCILSVSNIHIIITLSYNIHLRICCIFVSMGLKDNIFIAVFLDSQGNSPKSG